MSPRRSELTYHVRYLPQARIVVDGHADEPEWARAHIEDRFVFPWKSAAAPRTEFRALCDAAHLCFTFRVHDESHPTAWKPAAG